MERKRFEKEKEKTKLEECENVRVKLYESARTSRGGGKGNYSKEKRNEK